MAKANGKTWLPPHNMPTMEQLQVGIGQADDLIQQRPWLKGRVRVDPFSTNYLVNALASLLIQHRIVREDEVDYYVAMTEYQSKAKLEAGSREPPENWDPDREHPEPQGQPARILLPGRDF